MAVSGPSASAVRDRLRVEGLLLVDDQVVALAVSHPARPATTGAAPPTAAAAPSGRRRSSARRCRRSKRRISQPSSRGDPAQLGVRVDRDRVADEAQHRQVGLRVRVGVGGGEVDAARARPARGSPAPCPRGR